MMHMCRKCGSVCALAVLALGIAFLLRDLGVWGFWNVQWWTAAFLLAGLAKLGWSCCHECQDMDKKRK